MRYYFVRIRAGRPVAHIAEGNDKATILLGPNYRTLCGHEIAPKKWGLAEGIDRRTLLCVQCKEKLDETV